MEAIPAHPELLTPGAVARMFRVTPQTVSRWGQSGKLPVVVTDGGHRRFPAEAIYAALATAGVSKTDV